VGVLWKHHTGMLWKNLWEHHIGMSWKNLWEHHIGMSWKNLWEHHIGMSWKNLWEHHIGMSWKNLWERLQPRQILPQLTVLAPPTVIATDDLRLGIVLRLAGDTETNTRDCLAAGLGNRLVTFFAVTKAFPTRNLVASPTNRILDGCIDLILYCPVFCESASHV